MVMLLLVFFPTMLVLLTVNQTLSVLRKCCRFSAILCLLDSLSSLVAPMFPACALMRPTAHPTFGVRKAHPGGQPPSCEGCCRDARSPGPRQTQGGVPTVPTV